MKKHVFTFTILLTISLSSCNSSKKSDEVASYSYEEETVEMSAALKAKMPEWVEEGKICYGLVVQLDEVDKKPVIGKPVKAKVVQIGKHAVTMKALETVNMAKSEKCTKMSLSKGQTWEENEDEADLYLTREDAINRLKELKLYKISDRVTVD